MSMTYFSTAITQALVKYLDALTEKAKAETAIIDTKRKEYSGYTIKI